jgi:hypothetical protein
MTEIIVERLRACYLHMIEVFTHCFANTSEIAQDARQRFSHGKYIYPFSLLFKSNNTTDYEACSPVDEENPYYHNQSSTFQQPTPDPTDNLNPFNSDHHNSNSTKKEKIQSIEQIKAERKREKQLEKERQRRKAEKEKKRQTKQKLLGTSSTENSPPNDATQIAIDNMINTSKQSEESDTELEMPQSKRSLPPIPSHHKQSKSKAKSNRHSRDEDASTDDENNRVAITV